MPARKKSRLPPAKKNSGAEKKWEQTLKQGVKWGEE